MFPTVPKRLLSKAKVQRDLDTKGVERVSRETGGQAIKSWGTFFYPETENKALKGIFY